MRTLIPALRRALRIALPPVLAVSGLTAAAAPSSATAPLGVSQIKLLVWDGSYYEVCGKGSVPSSLRVAGTWVMTISGIRADANESSLWQIDPPPVMTTAWDFDHCEYVFPWGFPYGEFEVGLAYVAAGEYTGVYSAGGGTWAPQTGLRSWAVNPVCGPDPC